jgi:cytochrome c oxidase subunit 2
MSKDKLEYQNPFQMGLKRLFQFKWVPMLLIALFVMVQGAVAQSSSPLGGGGGEAEEAAKSTMWLGVSYYVVLFLLLCVVVAVIGRILKIYELTIQIQGKKQGINWNQIMAVVCIIFLVLGLYGTYWSYTRLGSMILPEAATIHGVKLDQMLYLTLIITTIVLVLTQVALFVFSYMYRGREDRKAYFYPHNNTLEKIWTIVPAIALTVLVLMGFFTWRGITNNVQPEGEPAALDIDVTGRQFAWEIRYPGADGLLGLKNYKLVTPTNTLGVDFKDRKSLDDLRADEIVLPVGKPVRFNIIAQDVIHSVYIPHFRVQMNAVPGLPTHFLFTPTITTAEMRTKLDDPNFEYVLLCNKICGSGHYNMQKTVRVVSESEYREWLASQKPYLTDQLRNELKLADSESTEEAEENIVALNN